MDETEAHLIEQEIRAEAERVALALADYPPLARDVQSLLGEFTRGVTPNDVQDFYGIGTADDHQDQDGNRRGRQLAELGFALDSVLGRKFS